MNFKYYLRGLGTGIVVTLIIVTISNSLRGGKTASENAAQPSSVQPTSADATSADAASADVTSADVISADTSSAETVSDNVQQGQQGRNITVSFETIQSSEAAAQLLEKAGIVDNWRNFNSYLVNNGYDRKVSGGTFSFSGNESYKEIAGIITKSR